MKTSSITLAVGGSAVVLAALSFPAFAADEVGKPNATKTAVADVVGKVRADDDMLAVLKAMESLHPKAIEKVDPPTARKNPTVADAVNVVLKQQGRSTRSEDLVPGVTSLDTTIMGSAGPLPARVFTPQGAGPFPVVVYFHGGGWVLANKQVHDDGARGIAKEANAVVVSVDYRLAPEHRFPAAWDDALASYKWALGNAAKIKGDPKRVGLAGESAGGNLALATPIAARDAGLQKPAHVLAVYPVTQASLNTESEIENAVAQPLNRAMVRWFVDHLVRSKADLKDPRLQLDRREARRASGGHPDQRTDRPAAQRRLEDGRRAREGWRSRRATRVRRRHARVLRHRRPSSRRRRKRRPSRASG